jgi:diacylglycerol O-acyltransferase / wax synthase
MHQLSGTDATMLVTDRPGAPNLITAVEIYDPGAATSGVRFKDILQRFEERSSVSTIFTHKLVRVPLGLDFPYWVRDLEFDVEFHVRHLALPKPGDWRQLAIQIARLAARPVDMTRPPWEAYVIEGLDHVEGVPKGSFALLLKLHHAAVDGQGGNEIVTAIHDDHVALQPPEVDLGTDDLSRRWLLLSAGKNAVRRPGIAVRVARSAITSVRPPRLRRSAPTRPRPTTATTRFNGPVSAHRVWDTRFFALSDLKLIKDSVPGATVNDVAIALVGGALRSYLAAHGELPDQSLVAIMPISVRSGTDAAASNQVVMMQVPLGSHIEDPLERLAAVRDATTEAKAKGASAQNLMELSELMPGALPGVAARTLTAMVNRAGHVAGAHTLVTNVPGPRAPLHLLGAELVKMTGVPPVFDGMGLVHGIGSYVDEVQVIFTACRAMMPDPQAYSACIDESVEALLAAARSSQPKKAAPTD